MTEGYARPPRKEDLERLYVTERLSVMKIAKVYDLRYRNPKLAESTILYNLKRNGIKRRDPAEHFRKVTEAMVDEWVRRYQTGESLEKIAAGEFSPVTILPASSKARSRASRQGRSTDRSGVEARNEAVPKE